MERLIVSLSHHLVASMDQQKALHDSLRILQTQHNHTHQHNAQLSKALRKAIHDMGQDRSRYQREIGDLEAKLEAVESSAKSLKTALGEDSSTTAQVEEILVLCHKFAKAEHHESKRKDAPKTPPRSTWAPKASVKSRRVNMRWSTDSVADDSE